MKKCLKITFNYSGDSDFIHGVQKLGSKLAIEGTIQHFSNDKNVRIIVCGEKEMVDKFIDVLHKESVKIDAPDIKIEPFIRDKDYRSVFRVIE
jgi:acylphosphatase